MEVIFSLCKSSEVDEVVAFVNRAYRGDSSRSGWTTEADLLEGQRTDSKMIRSIIQSKDNQIWIARNPQSLDIVGLFHLEKDPERAFLGMLTVEPSLQSKGLGKILLKKGEELVQLQWGLQKIFMTVISLRTELISYYLRRGFHDTQEKKAFPMNDPRFGIPKRNDFYFKILMKEF